jgi:isoquinoline 1-oxidoreductase beta subunit
MITRRGFIVSGTAVGGGLLLGYGYKALDDGDAANKFAAQGETATPFNAWLKITSEGKIICGIHRAEMGQGIITTLAMLLAEELDADWDDVGFEFVPVDRDYFNFGMLKNGQPLGDPNASWAAATGTWAIREAFHALGMSMTIASSSTIDAWDSLRPAGASARHMLLSAAARVWGKDVALLRTEKSHVYDTSTKLKLSYGELAELAGKESPPSTLELKDKKDYKLVGHNPPRLDTPIKVNGSARFGLDVQLPNMLYATVVHNPVVGTRVVSFNRNGADKMPGVHGIVEAGAPGYVRAVAVVAESSWQALQAAKQITFTDTAPGKLVSTDNLTKEYTEYLKQEPRVIFFDTDTDTDTAAESVNNEAAGKLVTA